MKFGFQNVVMHILKLFFLCLGLQKNVIKILVYYTPIIFVIHHFFRWKVMKSGSPIACFHPIGLIESFWLLKENGKLSILMDKIDTFRWTLTSKWMQFGWVMSIFITLMSTHFNVFLQFMKWKVHHLCIMGFNIYVRIAFGFNNYLQKDCQPCRALFFQFCNEVKMVIYHTCKVIMTNLAINKKWEWKEMKHPSILFVILFDFNTIFGNLSVLSIKP
jgi:hypothetical protein